METLDAGLGSRVYGLGFMFRKRWSRLLALSGLGAAISAFEKSALMAVVGLGGGGGGVQEKLD